MNEPEKGPLARRTSYYIGWCVLLAAGSQLPVIYTALTVAGIAPKLTATLLWFSLPATLLLFFGGMGLIYGKLFGFYLVYAAAFFGSLGGLKIPLVPFAKQVLDFGPASADAIILLNLLILGLLVWEHFSLLTGAEPRQRRIHHGAVAVILACGLASMAYGRAMMPRGKGVAETSAALPFVAEIASPLKFTSPAKYVYVHAKLQDGVTQVVSGTATEESVKEFAQTHNLKAMEKPEAHRKFLPQVKAWKLDPKEFPSAFGPADLYYVGRASTASKLSIQLCYRRSDSRFTAQFLGLLANPDGPDETEPPL